MSGTGGLHDAFVAGTAGSEADYAGLLQSIVEVARSIFGARASSIFVLDEATDELVFAAVAGEGSRSLVGTRIPSATGIAGWVLVTRQPLVVENVAADPRFAREAAESTGYVPHGLMAVPLLHEERTLGVLEVLDRPQQGAFSLAETDLLGLFAGQAAIALDLLLRARRVRDAVETSGGELAPVARLAATIDALEGSTREAGLRLLGSLADLLQVTRTG